MKRLVDIGENGTDTYKTPISSINKSGSVTLSGNYYIQNYTVTANVEITKYSVAIANFPTGTIITDSAGTTKTEFNAGQSFQIRIPKNLVGPSDINGRIIVNTSTKSYPLFYGKTYDSKLQNYAITADPIVLSNGTANLDIKGNTGTIKVKKVDVDTNKPIPNTIFELSEENGTVIGTATTNSEGVVTFTNLYQKTYNLREIKNNDNYVLSDEITKVIAEYNKTTEIQVTNEHKKGQIRVIKVDKDNNEIKLANVEFNVVDSKGNIVDTLKTDTNRYCSKQTLTYK